MSDTNTEAVQALIRKLRSQIGDDVQEVYSHDTLFKRASETLTALQARAEAAEARERAILASNDEERKALVEAASLRHRVKKLTADRDRLATAHAQMQRTLDRLTADNERLREALQYIADSDECTWPSDHARAALAASQSPDPVTNADSQQPEGTKE